MEESCLLEDGEIADPEPCEISLPSNNYLVSHQKREPKTICSDESSNEKSDESDDDSDTQSSRPKRAKPELQLPLPETRKKVPDKYKVWSIPLEEEALTENLNKCDVESIDRERSVESYNYKLVYKTNNSSYYDDQQMPSAQDCFEDVMCEDEDIFVPHRGKRRHSDIKSRLGRKKSKIHVRRLPELSVTVTDSSEEVAKDIADNLQERKRDLILNVVLVLGKQKAIELYNETKDVEANGGIMLMSGERRRTSGGVYLLLLKRDDSITKENMKSIFAEEVEVKHDRRKLKAVKKRRHREKFDEVKEYLIKEKLLNLNPEPFVPSSGATLDLESNNLEEGEIELTVTNPPPSPATDQDTPPSVTDAFSEDEVEKTDQSSVTQVINSGRKFITYEDSDEDVIKLDAEEDDMDVF